MNNPKNIPIDSVMAKLGHAEEYLNSIKDEIRAWEARHPYTIIHNTDANLTHHSYILRIDIAPPIERWSLMIGDVVHNLRCGLDHLVYAVAIHESGQNPPPDDKLLMFPISKDCADFRKNGVNRIKHLSASVKATIESLQSDKRPHPDFPHLLSILRDFSNTDKHKLLRLAFSAVINGKISVMMPLENLTEGGNISANSGELEDGAEIATLAFSRPAPDVKYDFMISLSLWHGKKSPDLSDFSARTECISLLRLLLNEVRNVVSLVAQSA
jgi:hypothetical protein